MMRLEECWGQMVQGLRSCGEESELCLEDSGTAGAGSVVETAHGGLMEEDVEGVLYPGEMMMAWSRPEAPGIERKSHVMHGR